MQPKVTGYCNNCIGPGVFFFGTFLKCILPERSNAVSRHRSFHSSGSSRSKSTKIEELQKLQKELYDSLNDRHTWGYPYCASFKSDVALILICLCTEEHWAWLQYMQLTWWMWTGSSKMLFQGSFSIDQLIHSQPELRRIRWNQIWTFRSWGRQQKF